MCYKFICYKFIVDEVCSQLLLYPINQNKFVLTKVQVSAFTVLFILLNMNWFFTCRPKFLKITNYSWLFCIAIAIWIDFRESFRSSISITAQHIETQLMPNESLGRDLQVRDRLLNVRSLLHSVICVTKCQRPSNCFSFVLSSFFLLATLKTNLGLGQEDCQHSVIDEFLYMVAGCALGTDVFHCMFKQKSTCFKVNKIPFNY